MRLQDIPEIRRANAVLARAHETINKIEELNETYFNDKDYRLELVGGFVEDCQYDIQLMSDNYAFGIIGGEFKYLPDMVDKVEGLLESKSLWVFMKNNILKNSPVAYENFIKMTIKG